jgi:peptide/nickel transport system substrate-binding protein
MEILASVYLFLSSVFLSIVPGREFKEGVFQQPSSFYPALAQNSIEKTVSKLIFRGLFKYNIYGELENDLVDSYEISEDGLTYTFKIKDNQYWIDGKKITSEDILYTSYNSPSLQGISTDKIDELTVKFKLQNKYSPFISLMTQGIVQNNSLEKGNDLNPVSSGDFRVVRVKRSGPIVKEITLHSSKYKISKLTYRFYSSEDELYTAAKLGEIDAFTTEQEHNLPNFTNYRYPIISNSYGLFFNMSKDRLIDATLRKNIAKVIDYEEIDQKYGIPVEGVISKDAIYTDKKATISPFDSKFKENYSEKEIVIKSTNSKRNQEVLNGLKNYLEDSLKLSIEIKLYSNEEFIEEVVKKKDFDVIFFGIETQKDPDRYINWHSSGVKSGFNFTSYQNPIADKALEEGRSVTDLTKRLVNYNKFQEVFNKDLPAIYLFHPFNNFYISNRVTGIGEKYTFDSTDRYLDFSNWAIN